MTTSTERDNKIGEIFRKHLYSGTNIPEIEKSMGHEIAEVFDSNDFLMQALASQLVISSNIRKSSKCFHDIANQISESSYSLIENKFPHILFFISGRRKSFVSELHKRYEKISEGNHPSIKDLLAIRIVILNDTSQKILNDCYSIFVELVTSFTKVNNNFLNFPLEVSEPDRLITTSNFDPKKHPEIILPDKDIVSESIQRISKDYICFPKKNGYQSLHGSFEIPATSPKYAGLNLEIQIRTLKQHIWAEYQQASHSTYKKSRNEKMDKIFYFDPKRVSLAGYSEFFDVPGLIKAIPLCQRQKTF